MTTDTSGVRFSVASGTMGRQYSRVTESEKRTFRMKMKHMAARAALIFCATWAITFASVLARADVETFWVPMADGTELVTDVHLPEGDAPFPSVLLRSTYGRGVTPPHLIKAGYAVVVQDVRGMGESDGEPYVFHYEGWREGLTDGADTVAWIRRQPWCDGNVATYGGSALGITQALLAPSTDGLKAQFIHAAVGDLYHFAAYHGGVFRQNMLENWLKGIKQAQLIPIYREHPRYDAFWRYYNADARAAEITAPALFVGGWYDIFQQGIINAFQAREVNGGDGARGKNLLIMTWGAHGPDITDDYGLKGNRFEVKEQDVYRAFLDYHLRGNEHALDNVPKVHYYLMGDDVAPDAPGNEWRTADTWPPYPTHDTPFYLGADGALTMGVAAEDHTALQYTFDPANPVPTHGGANLFLRSGAFDQRHVREGRYDILVFATDPLEEPLEIVGRVRVKLFVSSDAPDTDFTAKLVDVFPAGDEREILMLDGIQRVKARYSLGEAAPLLTGPEEVVELEVDLWSTAWVLNTGHRIGLHVSSSNAPRFEVNPNTGADHPVAGEEMRTAVNRVHMGGVHPSRLILPVRPE